MEQIKAKLLQKKANRRAAQNTITSFPSITDLSQFEADEKFVNPSNEIENEKTSVAGMSSITKTSTKKMFRTKRNSSHLKSNTTLDGNFFFTTMGHMNSQIDKSRQDHGISQKTLPGLTQTPLRTRYEDNSQAFGH